MTLAEQRLLDSLPAVEADVLRVLFVECDARLVTAGVSTANPNVAVVPRLETAAPSVTSQTSLFHMRNEDQ